MAFYTYSHMKYEPCMFGDGSFGFKSFRDVLSEINVRTGREAHAMVERKAAQLTDEEYRKAFKGQTLKIQLRLDSDAAVIAKQALRVYGGYTKANTRLIHGGCDIDTRKSRNYL